MGIYLRILSESYPMNTNMTWIKCFSKNFAFVSVPCQWAKVVSVIGRVNFLFRSSSNAGSQPQTAHACTLRSQGDLRLNIMGRLYKNIKNSL